MDFSLFRRRYVGFLDIYLLVYINFSFFEITLVRLFYGRIFWFKEWFVSIGIFFRVVSFLKVSF